MRILSLFVLWTSAAFAASPPEFEFTKTLLPNSELVSTDMITGRFNGSSVSIYRGKESIESVVAALEKSLGRTLVAEEPDANWREVGRIFGAGGLGDATAHKQYVVDHLRFKVFIFELRSEGVKIDHVLLIIGAK